MAQAQKEKPLTSQEIDQRLMEKLTPRYDDDTARKMLDLGKRMASGQRVVVPATLNINIADLEKVRDTYAKLRGQPGDKQRMTLATGPLFKGPDRGPSIEAEPSRLAAVPKKTEKPPAEAEKVAVARKEAKAPVVTNYYDVTLGESTYRIATSKTLPSGVTSFATSRQAKLSTWLTQGSGENPIVSVTLPSGKTVKPGEPEYMAFSQSYRKEFQKMLVAEQSGREFEPIPISAAPKPKQT